MFQTCAITWKFEPHVQFQLRVCVHSKPEIIPVCLQPLTASDIWLCIACWDVQSGTAPPTCWSQQSDYEAQKKAALKGEELKRLVSVS